MLSKWAVLATDVRAHHAPPTENVDPVLLVHANTGVAPSGPLTERLQTIAGNGRQVLQPLRRTSARLRTHQRRRSLLTKANDGCWLHCERPTALLPGSAELGCSNYGS